jgi:hypothetical protein
MERQKAGDTDEPAEGKASEGEDEDAGAAAEGACRAWTRAAMLEERAEKSSGVINEGGAGSSRIGAKGEEKVVC